MLIIPAILNSRLELEIPLKLFFIISNFYECTHCKCLQGFTGTLQGFNAKSAGKILYPFQNGTKWDVGRYVGQK